MDEWNNDRVRDVSVEVYKMQLGADDTKRMLEKDGAKKLRERAGAYDELTKKYLVALNLKERTNKRGSKRKDDA